jgi:iron complex transport system permease protein
MMQARVWWLVWAGVLGALALVHAGHLRGQRRAGEPLIGPLLNPTQDPPQTAMAQQIVWQIRLPRTLGAWAAGALLGLAGAVAQGSVSQPPGRPVFAGQRFRELRWVLRWRSRPWVVVRACWAAT